MKKIIKMIINKKKKKTNVDVTKTISTMRNMLSELCLSLEVLNNLLKKICFKKT